MWFGVEYSKLPKLAADEVLPLLRGGGQRLAGRADGAAHHHHAALERRGVLVAEDQPELRQLVLALARARPVAGDAGIEQLGAQVGADGAGRGAGADSAERDGRQ